MRSGAPGARQYTDTERARRPSVDVPLFQRPTMRAPRVSAGVGVSSKSSEMGLDLSSKNLLIISNYHDPQLWHLTCQTLERVVEVCGKPGSCRPSPTVRDLVQYLRFDRAIQHYTSQHVLNPAQLTGDVPQVDQTLSWQGLLPMNVVHALDRRLRNTVHVPEAMHY
jgi:hypothetical protein